VAQVEYPPLSNDTANNLLAEGMGSPAVIIDPPSREPDPGWPRGVLSFLLFKKAHLHRHVLKDIQGDSCDRARADGGGRFMTVPAPVADRRAAVQDALRLQLQDGERQHGHPFSPPAAKSFSPNPV
jgi:hypothetical protein